MQVSFAQLKGYTTSFKMEESQYIFRNLSRRECHFISTCLNGCVSLFLTMTAQLTFLWWNDVLYSHIYYSDGIFLNNSSYHKRADMSETLKLNSFKTSKEMFLKSDSKNINRGKTATLNMANELL